jgi:methylated-DNA-[protein]-cysteine S-methyltransferase
MEDVMFISHTIIESPLGELTLVATDGMLSGLYFSAHRRLPNAATFGPRVHTGFEPVVDQLGEYFAGQRTQFDVPLSPRGSPFQLQVWNLLRTIPYGETRSYGHLARALGNPALAREVGGANARNPLSIIVPCHRVVGADGQLVGYAGGLERKQYLLDLEANATCAQLQISGLR